MRLGRLQDYKNGLGMGFPGQSFNRSDSDFLLLFFFSKNEGLKLWIHFFVAAFSTKLKINMSSESSF